MSLEMAIPLQSHVVPCHCEHAIFSPYHGEGEGVFFCHPPAVREHLPRFYIGVQRGGIFQITKSPQFYNKAIIFYDTRIVLKYINIINLY